MKRPLYLLLLSAALPAAALAQTAAPAPAPAATRAPMDTDFQGAHRQMEQIHTKLRTQLLALLTPAQRTLLAQTAGSLAVAPVPDVDGAVRRLDGALTASQKQAILAAGDAAHQQMRAFKAAEPPEATARPGLRHTEEFMRRRPPADPGRVLLMVALHIGLHPEHGPDERGEHESAH